jgi:hypothetical protein
VVEGVGGDEEFAVALGLPRLIPQPLARVPAPWDKAIACLPALMAAATLRALCAPAKASVKTLAADAGVCRRTIERSFAAVGLPTPGVLLRQAGLHTPAAGHRKDVAGQRERERERESERARAREDGPGDEFRLFRHTRPHAE